MTTRAQESQASQELRDLTLRWSAHTYDPLPVVLSHGTGSVVTDVDGRPYLDFLAAYSALNFGHRNPRLLSAAARQLDRLTLVSRAFDHDAYGTFCRDLASLCGKQMVLPMNTGAEAVETALKTARKWGYRVKGVRPEQANVVVMAGGFHGRTITIVSFSTDPLARDDYGPYTPGFRIVPFDDVAAVESAVDDATVAVLVEPVQGEGGVIVPTDGYLRALRELCTRRDVLLVADEIQSGLGRTGRTFACDHEGVVPDLYVLGKALGGGIIPISAVVGDEAVLGVFRPGEHGSTFGGNPLACAVAREVVAILDEGELQRRATVLGRHLAVRLDALDPDVVAAVRVRGLWAGIDLHPHVGTGRDLCEALLAEGVLAKDTHGSTIRLAPPLVITPDELDQGLDALERAVHALGHSRSLA
ncbi:MAG: ornithine--oxo-acid transaminase [Motilibacteraceae bacterium]